jgi:hypothetical protein
MNPETAVVVDRFWSKVDKSGPCWLWTGALSEHGPPENRVTFRVSATKLKRFLQCPRSYFLRYVQGVEEDVKGSYLIVGNAFDQAVQHYLSQGARGVASIDPKIVRMLGAARPLLPDPGTVEVQHEYSVSHPDGFVVEGKPDLRRVGDGRAWIGDTKTCASREWALTPGTLRTNEQALLYAWCELEAGNLGPVNATWTYVTKATKPEAWNVTALLSRGEVYAWFDAVVRPAVAAMRLAAAEYDADRVVANLDGCERCWTKRHCNPFEGPNQFSTDQVANAINLVTLKRCASTSKPSGEPCSNAVTTQTHQSTPTMADAGYKSATDGDATSGLFSMTSAQDRHLLTLLSDSITMVRTRRETSSGQPAQRTTQTGGSIANVMARSPGTLGCTETETSGPSKLVTVPPVSTWVASQPPKKLPEPATPTLSSMGLGFDSISLDAVSFLGQLQSAIPVLPANVEREMGFNLASLSEPETAVEVSETPTTAIAINPPPVRARKPARTPTETPTQSSLEDLASELQTVVDTCQTAIARVDRLLAALRGKGAA